MNLYETLKLKKFIETKEKENSESQGKIKLLLQQLKDKFGINSLEQAQAVIHQNKKNIEIEETIIKDLIEKYEEKYGQLEI
jgi:hypothetical protein